MTGVAQVALRDQGQATSAAARAQPLAPTTTTERFPSVAPTLADRASALLARMGALAWLYALVPVPLVTDWIENGALPTSPRGWITEVVGGIVIGALVSMVRRNQLAPGAAPGRARHRRNHSRPRRWRLSPRRRRVRPAPAGQHERAGRTRGRPHRDCCACHDSLWAVRALDVSAGIVEFAPDEAPGELIRRSDAAMYLQKQSRRDSRRG